MKLQDQVCTLEQAKRLKELGIGQDSHFSWCGDEQMRLRDEGRDGVSYSDLVFVSTTIPFNSLHEDHRSNVPSSKPFAAAFTVSELGAMMPDSYEVIQLSEEGKKIQGCNYWAVKTYYEQECECCGEMQSHIISNTEGQTEAESRAALLIYLLENKLTTPEECNQRLIN